MFAQDFGVETHFNVFCYFPKDYTPSIESVDVSAFLILAPCHIPIEQEAVEHYTEFSAIGELGLGLCTPPSDEQKRRLKLAMTCLRLSAELEGPLSGFQSKKCPNPATQTETQPATSGKLNTAGSKSDH